MSIVNSSAIDCLESLVSEITCYNVEWDVNPIKSTQLRDLWPRAMDMDTQTDNVSLQIDDVALSQIIDAVGFRC